MTIKKTLKALQQTEQKIKLRIENKFPKFTLQKLNKMVLLLSFSAT